MGKPGPRHESPTETGVPNSRMMSRRFGEGAHITDLGRRRAGWYPHRCRSVRPTITVVRLAELMKSECDLRHLASGRFFATGGD